MNEVTMIGIDLAKSVFQAHGATAVGEPVFRKKLSRGQFFEVPERTAALRGRDGSMCVIALLGPRDHEVGP